MAELLAPHFLGAAGAGFELVPDLAVRLEAIVRDARGAWPEVSLSAEAFVGYLGERLPKDGDRARALDRWHATDLYLAYGCSLQDPVALRELDRQFLGQIGAFVSRVSTDRTFIDDLTQLLRQKLLLGEPPGRAKILEYSGQGALGGWLRIAAVRTALNLRRGTQISLVSDTEIELASSDLDHATKALKGESQREFALAFSTTLQALGADDRNLLRLYYLDGLTIDQLAGLLKTPRSTVARRLGRCRSELLAATRARLAAQLQLPADEIDSLIRVAVSRLDLTISKFMK